MDRSIRKNNIKRWGRLLSVLICVQLSFVAVANQQENFLCANQQYAAGEYQSALDMYEGISKKGAAVWYNMGNCLFHLGNYPQALVYWLRARSQGDIALYDKATYNIEYMYTVMNKNRYVSVQQMVYQKIDRVCSGVSLLLIQCVVLLCWVFMFFLWNRSTHGTVYIILRIILFTVLVAGGAALYVKYENSRYKVGVVMKDKQALVSGPNADYHQLATVDSADVVTIYEAKDGWYKVKNSTMIGWISSDVVQIV